MNAVRQKSGDRIGSRKAIGKDIGVTIAGQRFGGRNKVFALATHRDVLRVAAAAKQAQRELSGSGAHTRKSTLPPLIVVP